MRKDKAAEVMFKTVDPLNACFIETETSVRLELMNTSDQTLKFIEILTVFLKDEGGEGGVPSQVHIAFDGIKHLRPNEKAMITHRTWMNGQPTGPERDQLERLIPVKGVVKPYVLDISWQNAEGKSRFQRIPIGH